MDCVKEMAHTFGKMAVNIMETSNKATATATAFGPINTKTKPTKDTTCWTKSTATAFTAGETVIRTKAIMCKTKETARANSCTKMK